jgi:hypothetical protein
MEIRSCWACWRPSNSPQAVGKQRQVFRKTRTYLPRVQSRSMSVFASWPPGVTTEQLDKLTLLATTYALSHSILYLPPISPEKGPPPAPESAILAPISLIPTPIPRHLFSKALTLQHAYNTLYARVALDTSFLDQVMGPGGVADVDDFTSALWTTWKTLRDEGVPPVRRALLNVIPVPLCADGVDFLPASPARPLSL